MVTWVRMATVMQIVTDICRSAQHVCRQAKGKYDHTCCLIHTGDTGTWGCGMSSIQAGKQMDEEGLLQLCAVVSYPCFESVVEWSIGLMIRMRGGMEFHVLTALAEKAESPSTAYLFGEKKSERWLGQAIVDFVYQTDVHGHDGIFCA